MSILRTKELSQLRWLFLSPKERYAHLWAITKKSSSLGYTIRKYKQVKRRSICIICSGSSLLSLSFYFYWVYLLTSLAD